MSSTMWTLPSLALIAAVFVVAGFFKGVVGFGLPTVVIAILTAIHGLTEAMALMIVPAFATNIWQAVVGGRFAELMRRLWPFLLAACVATWFASGLLAAADARVLAAGLGGLLLVYSLISLATPQAPPPGRHEVWMSPVFGTVNGTISGLTGTYMLPSGLYLQALGLDRIALVQAMGIVFTVSSGMLGLSLAGRSLMPADLAGISAAALVPAFAGLWIGQRLRKRLPEKTFRTAFFAALAGLGAYLIWRSAT